MAQLGKFPLDIRKNVVSVRVVWGQVVWTVHGVFTLEAVTNVTSPKQAAQASPDWAEGRTRDLPGPLQPPNFSRVIIPALHLLFSSPGWTNTPPTAPPCMPGAPAHVSDLRCSVMDYLSSAGETQAPFPPANAAQYVLGLYRSY